MPPCMFVQLFKLLSAEGTRQLASRSGRKINTIILPFKKAYMIQCQWCQLPVERSKSTIFATLPVRKAGWGAGGGYLHSFILMDLGSGRGGYGMCKRMALPLISHTPSIQFCQSAETPPNMRSKSEWDYKMWSYNSALSTIRNATQILWKWKFYSKMN